jgi:type III pantothenate kinase
MLLAIDCGNTNVVFSVFDGRDLKGVWRARTDDKRTADEYAVWLIQILSLNGIPRDAIDGIVMASVVPAAVFNLETLCRRYFGHKPLVVGRRGVELGMRVLINRPEQVGPDRLVNAVAAHALHSQGVIVIDFGTGTTFDVIDRAGDYRGGIIAPGVNHSVEALYTVAARLPRIDIRRPDQVVGTDTVSAMQSGVFWGYVGLIEGIVMRVREAFPEPLKTVATGGLAPLFSEATDAIEEVDPTITLTGLRLIYERNAGNPT